MNARVAFDTHAFVKRLEAAGMSAAQAEALAEAMGDIVLPAVATKSDLKGLGQELRTEIRALGQDLRTEMKQLAHDLRTEMKELELRLRTEMKELEVRLMIRMGGMIAASTAITVAILGALITLS